MSHVYDETEENWVQIIRQLAEPFGVLSEFAIVRRR